MAEIKISELSIGDWISDKNGIAAQVRGIECWSDGYVVNVRTKAGTITNLTVGGVLPIPLLPKILEKNGFRKLDRFNEYVIGEWDSNPFIAVRLAEKFVEPTILVKNGGTSTHLFGSRGVNVHQLQHALRLAGVGKEIEV